MKICKGCNESKPLDGFYRHAAMHDGFMSRCIDCTKSAVRARRRLDESVRDYDRQRGNRQTTEAVRDYRAAHPDAYRAHNAVNNAVRDGRLKKEPCLFCSNPKVHGHHRDYSRPLEIVWLCARCHHRLHAYFPETAAHEPKSRKAA